MLIIIFMIESLITYLIAFLLILIIAKSFGFISKIFIEKYLKKVKYENLFKMERAIRFLVFYSIILIGIYYLVKDFGSSSTRFYVRGILLSTIAIVISYGIKKVSDATVELAVERSAKHKLLKLSRDMENVIKNIVDIVIVTISIIVILGIWGISIGPLVTSMGLIGAAVAFAAQTTISNFFAGLIIFFDKRIRVGDYVKFNGISGVVEEIRTMSTRIRTWNGTLVTVPNSSIVSNPVEDRHLPLTKKVVKITFSFVYGTNVDKARKVILNTVKKIKTVLKNPEPTVQLVKLGDYSVDLLLIAKVKSIEDVWSTTNEINEKVYNACNKAKLEFAFPTQTIDLKKNNPKKK